MSPPTRISRRTLLVGTPLAVTALSLPGRAQTPIVAPSGMRTLRARPGFAALWGVTGPLTPIWGYDGTAPGPLLRVKRGDELRVRLVNELPAPTSLHWHGVRAPNAMDGVAGLTQPPVAPGADFEYVFRPPDAGTFWYHPAGDAVAQIRRGLRGALIVDEVTPVAVDRDVLLLFENWLLAPDGDNSTSHVTVNGEPELEIPVRTHERLRLRLVHAAAAQALRLRIERHAPLVMAIDGQPAEPYLAQEGRLILGPGNRIDVVLDITLRANEHAAIQAENFRRPIVTLACGGEPMRDSVLPEPQPLPPNPLPQRLDLRTALRHEIRLDMLASLPGPQPLFTVRRGRVVVLALVNRAAVATSVHVHGHHVRHLDRLDDGWKPYWLDTISVPPGLTERVAFLADNPGQWLIEAQPLAPAQATTATWFAVG